MKQWVIKINGEDNEICFIPNQWSGKHRLIVNGKEANLKRSPFQAFVGTDQLINVAGKIAGKIVPTNNGDLSLRSL